MQQIAMKFVQWDVPELEKLKEKDRCYAKDGLPCGCQ